MTNYTPRLLTPPREEEEVYPYRRVWFSIIVENSILFVAAVAAYVSYKIIGIDLPHNLTSIINVVLALMPAALWHLFSYRSEQRVIAVRQRLLVVAIITGLAANAVGIPVIEWLATDRWLPHVGAIDRVLGYAVTVGVVQEALKYLVLWFCVWPDYLRIRVDTVAYAASSAVGYATILNLHFVLGSTPTPDVVAARVFYVMALHLVASCVISYGLAELKFNPTSFLLLPFTVFVAVFLTGFAIALRSGLINAGIVQGVAGTNDLFALAFTGVYMFGLLVAIAFLFAASEREEREAVASREV